MNDLNGTRSSNYLGMYNTQLPMGSQYSYHMCVIIANLRRNMMRNPQIKYLLTMESVISTIASQLRHS